MIQLNPCNGSTVSCRTDSSLQIAVLIEIDDTWGRNVVEAIARYAKEFGWQLLIAPRDAQRRLRIPSGWNGDGVIALLRDNSLVEHLRDLNLPTVNVSGMFHEQRWTGHVATDDMARARLAYDHFQRRKLEHFACYSPAIGRYSDYRAESFVHVVRDEGYPCEVLAPDKEHRHRDFGLERGAIAARIASLPRPTGIFAADPYPARQLVEICLSLGVSVPGEILILSGDEDELLCNLIVPPISSIELASHRIGLEASKMLSSIIKTGRVPQVPLLVKPLRVCQRRSTNYIAVGDPSVEAALEYIWRCKPDQICIKDLVSVAAMSRRSLEQRFRETLGCSPAEEIRRVRLEKARQMLLDTTMSVASIAIACGFSSGPYLTHAFRKYLGMVPSEVRVGRKQSE